MRWLPLSLTAVACAAALVAFRSLSTSATRGSAVVPRVTVFEAPHELARAAEPVAEAPVAQRQALAPQLDGVSGEVSEEASERLDPALVARAQDATEQLALALAAPEFEDARWRAEVETRARTLGRAALPALRSLQADESLSVEAHVAANELVAVLEER